MSTKVHILGDEDLFSVSVVSILECHQCQDLVQMLLPRPSHPTLAVAVIHLMEVTAVTDPDRTWVAVTLDQILLQAQTLTHLVLEADPDDLCKSKDSSSIQTTLLWRWTTSHHHRTVPHILILLFI